MELVDSSSWIDSLRPTGDPVVRSRLAALLAVGHAAWCPVVRLELWHGARGAAEKAVLARFEQIIPELDITAEVWELACDLSHKARAAGRTVPVPDLLVAACARHHQVALEHADAHLTFLQTL